MDPAESFDDFELNLNAVLFPKVSNLEQVAQEAYASIIRAVKDTVRRGVPPLDY